MEYRFIVRVNWSPDANEQKLKEDVARCRTEHGRKLVHNHCPWGLPLRLWQSFLAHLGIGREVMWNQLPRDAAGPLIATILGSEFAIDGKSMNKDEFVTCGGVRLDEVNFKTMESRKCRGLYLAGEILDIDGVTGGFNFQAAWTTGWIAGKSMGQDI
jgi:predicted Rossmann fold flavoprotein